MVISKLRIVNQPDTRLESVLPTGLEGILTAPIVTLVGPNGSGKTAFLRMMMSSYYHYVDNVRIPSQAKKFAEEDLIKLKRGIDYFKRDGTINEKILRECPPSSERASRELESISSFLTGETDWYFSGRERVLQGKRELREILRTHFLLTQEAEQKLKDYGEKGHRFCSYGETVKSRPIQIHFRPGSSNLWGLTTTEVETLKKQLMVREIPTDHSQVWRYVEIECPDNFDTLYLLGFSIKRHPFDRVFKGGATALGQELEYYNFEDRVADWTGKAKSSGQSTLAEVEIVKHFIHHFFQEGIYKRPIPSKDPIDKYIVKEERQISPEQRATATLVVLMDEPTTSLDYKASKQFARTLQEMTGQYAGRLQCFVATHDPAIIELPQTQCMDFYEQPAQLKDHPPIFE